MIKPLNILLGWWFWFTDRHDELANKRLPICVECDLRRGFVCGVCGCPLQAKSRVADENCPHPDGDKWKKASFPR